MTTRNTIISAALVAALACWPAARWLAPASADTPSRVLPKMVTRDAASRVDKGLRYLERTQRQDGSWLNSGGWGIYPVVMTSLAGLAFLANGSTPESGPYQRSVSRALNYVLNVAEAGRQQNKKEILIAGGGEESRSMYGHGFGMLFLAECYGMEGDKSSDRAQRIKAVLDGAVNLTARAQSDLGPAQKHAGGWIYTPDGRSDEGSVTVTQLQALRACRNVGVKVPRSTIERAVLYLKFCQQADGGICYSVSSRGSSLPAISAAAVACFYSAGVYDEHTGGRGLEAKMVERLIEYCKKNVNVDGGAGHYFYTQLYYSQGMYQRGGEDWENYYPRIRDRLAGMQAPDGNWNGDGIGPIYGTAIACMILQLPYGYLPVMQR